MTYKITSASSNKSMTTKDPLKDASWGNKYYGVDDCVRIEVPEETQEHREAIERKCELLAKIKSLEDGILYSIIDCDKVFEDKKRAERLLLKQEMKGLSC